MQIVVDTVETSFHSLSLTKIYCFWGLEHAGEFRIRFCMLFPTTFGQTIILTLHLMLLICFTLLPMLCFVQNVEK